MIVCNDIIRNDSSFLVMVSYLEAELEDGNLHGLACFSVPDEATFSKSLNVHFMSEIRKSWCKFT